MTLEKKRNFEWIGEPEVLDGSYQYKSIKVNDALISVGDSVLIKSFGKGPDYVALITELHRSLFSGDNNLRVQWYFRPDEVERCFGRNKLDSEGMSFSKQELILSDMKDLLSVECIHERITVNSNNTSGGGDFVCQLVLDTVNKKIQPLIADLAEKENEYHTPMKSASQADTKSLRRSSRKRPLLENQTKLPSDTPETPQSQTNSGFVEGGLSTVKKLQPDRRCKTDGRENLFRLSVPFKITPPQYSRPSKHSVICSSVKREFDERTPELRSKTSLHKDKKQHDRACKSLAAVHEEMFRDSDSEDESESDGEEEPIPRKPARKRRKVIAFKPGKTPLKKMSPVNSSTIKTPSKKISTMVTHVPVRVSKPQVVKGPEREFESVKERLHVSAVPDTLTCRENQYADILSFVEGKLLLGGGGCMYISGVPGTGKTATVLEVSRSLREAADAGEIPQFRFIEINGLRLTEPRQAYVAILKQLTGEKTTPDKAAAILEQYFCSPAGTKRKSDSRKKQSILLLADELDLLWTRKQSVLYNLFDWPSHPNAKLIVLAVANTMDLPERLMMNRVSSRLGLTRLTFQPYSFQQLQEIIAARLTGLKVFEQDAIQFASRKVAAVSGDARRALDICRRAVEIAQRGKDGEGSSKRKKKGSPKQLLQPVGMSHVQAAVEEMFASPMVTAIRGCSLNQKLLLHALLSELKRTGLEETTVKEVYLQLTVICRMQDHPVISPSEGTAICRDLAAVRLILLESGRGDINRRVRLNVSQDDIHFALRDSHIL